MKTVLRVCILSLIIINASCSSETRDWSELHDRDSLVYTSNSDKPFTGTAIERYASGQIATECGLRRGVLHGTSTHWYENGQKARELHYKDGKEYGLSASWYESGRKEREDHYGAARGHTVETYWYESGQKKMEIHFNGNHELHGLYVCWGKNGMQTSKKEYANSKLIKEYRLFSLDEMISGTDKAQRK